MATPNEVQATTGYRVGGVSPFGAPDGLTKVIDESVFSEPRVNIGSGTPEIGIELSSSDLRRAWSGTVAKIT